MRAGASSPPAPELTLCELRQGWLCAKWRLHGDAEVERLVKLMMKGRAEEDDDEE